MTKVTINNRLYDLNLIYKGYNGSIWKIKKGVFGLRLTNLENGSNIHIDNIKYLNPLEKKT